MENEKEIARIEVVMHEKTEEMHGASIKVSGSGGEVLQLLECGSPCGGGSACLYNRCIEGVKNT